MLSPTDFQRFHDDIAALSSAIEPAFESGDVAVARAACIDLRTYLTDLAAADHDHLEVRKVLGMGWYDLGVSYRDLKDVERAEAAYHAAIIALEPLLESKEHAEDAATQIAASRNHLGLLFMEHGPEGLAAGHLDDAIADREALVELYPHNDANRVFLGGALCNRGHVERHVGRSKAAHAFYLRAIDVLEAVIPPCDCGCRDATAAPLSNVKGHPHWIVMAHTFLCHATAGKSLAEKERRGA